MGNISIVKIADVAKYRKDFITIDNHKDYKRCRVQLHKRGVLLRDIVKGNYIKTKKQRVCKKDDFIFAEMDAKFGGYGIIPKELEGAVVSSHYYLFELDRSKVLPDYLSVLIDTDVIQSQIKAKGSTNYSRVSPSEVLEFEIPCPHIEEQKRVISFYLNAKNTLLQLNEENSFQQKYFSQLRQSILQDAIEGKLTVAWRKKNPVKKGDPETDAAALLEKIKKEKQKLIAEGKIKKDKPLASIKPEEVPFKLPPGWLWTRLGEVSSHNSGKTLDALRNKGDSVKYITTSNLYWGYFVLDELREMPIKKEEMDRCTANKGDLLICEGGEAGRAAVWMEEYNICFQNHIHRVRPYCKINSFYLFRYFEKLNYSGEINKYRKGMGISNLSGKSLSSIRIPLPSLAEQGAIVERVDELLRIVDELEKEAAARKTLSESLMQAVLREAFEGEGEMCKGT